jgi:hypothetical protein
MKQNIVVHRPTDLSRGWAQGIVNHYAADAKVSDISIQSVSVGTSTRLRVLVNHDAPHIVPLRWFIKTPSLAMKSRIITALPRLLHKEVHFYQSLSKESPVKLPHILAAQTRCCRGSTLVMSDLAESGVTPGQPDDALSLHQARQVIQQLARFHAHYWNNRQLLQTHRWLSGFNNRAEHYMGNLLAVPLMKQGLKSPPIFISLRFTMRLIATALLNRLRLAHKHWFITIVIPAIYSGKTHSRDFWIGS